MESKEQAYNKAVKENLELLKKIKMHLKWGQSVDNPDWCDVGNQGYVNQQLNIIADFLGLQNEKE